MVIELIQIEFIQALSVLGLGFVLGLEHALDADHVAAVTALVSKSKKLKQSSLLGASWGLGHTATLLIVGLLVLGLKLTIPESIALSLEGMVGIILIILGLSVLKTIFIDKKHSHLHKHGKEIHSYFHSHNITERSEAKRGDHTHLHKSFAIGIAHGLAGSAALMLLVLNTIDSILVGLMYIIIFGLGSVIGMLIVSTLIGLPFKLTAKKHDQLNTKIQITAGIISLLLGLIIVNEIWLGLF